MAKFCSTLKETMYCFTVLFWVLTFLPAADVQPVWTSSPSRTLSVVESENITLLWQYNMNGTQLSYTKFFKMMGDGQSKKLIALKPASSSVITVDSAFQDRFFFNISETRASVKILAVQRSDKGTYQYEVSNQDLVTINNDVKMTVLYSPNITDISKNQEVNEGDIVILNCTADGNPTPSISWTRASDNASVSFLQTINNKHQEGLYRCTAKNGIGRPASRDVNIHVKNFHPVNTQLNTSLKRDSVVFNITFNITCSAQANPPAKYRLFKGKGTSMEYLGISTTGLFTAVVSSKEDRQVNYSCVPYNRYGNGSLRFTTVALQYIPQLTVLETRPENRTILFGSDVIFNCDTDASPRAHLYKLYFMDTLIVNSSSGVFNITVKADGVYTCVPINTVGTGDKATVRITVVVPPSLNISSPTNIAREGDNLVLTCNAVGTPEPIITWTMFGSSKALSNTSSLTVTNIRRPGSHDNILKYQCTASNGVQSPATAIATITVHYPPTTAILRTFPDNNTVLNGSIISLKCDTDASPEAHVYHFYLNGNHIGWSKSGVFHVTVESDGEYTCAPLNEIGTGENASVLITVVVAPSVDIFSSNNIAVEGSILELTCNTSGLPKPVITWKKVDDSSVLARGSSQITVKLTRPRAPLNTAQYQCIADNGVGIPAKATATITVLYAAQITVAPINQTVQVGEYASLHCRAVGSPTPVITWIHESEEDNVNLGSGNLLHFDSTKFSDSGWYKCSADNNVGPAVTASAYLDVAESASSLINGKMTITNEKFDASLQNKDSERYRKLSERVVNVVHGLFENDNSYQATGIKGFESGSVVVVFIMRFKRVVRVDYIISVLRNAAADRKLGNFIVDPLSVTAIKEENITLGSSINPTKSTSANTSGSLWIIIGPVLGSIVVIIIAVIVFCYRRRNKSHKGKRDKDMQSIEMYAQIPKSAVVAGRPTVRREPQQLNPYKKRRHFPDGSYEDEIGVRLDSSNNMASLARNFLTLGFDKVGSERALQA